MKGGGGRKEERRMEQLVRKGPLKSHGQDGELTSGSCASLPRLTAFLGSY